MGGDPRLPLTQEDEPLAALIPALPHTRVRIEAAEAYGIDLIASFCPAPVPGIEGEQVVAGVQTVDTRVSIDFNRVLPLSWLAYVYHDGEIAPNGQTVAYTSDADSFLLPVTRDIRLKHDAAGWHIPAYDSARYRIAVGFALGVAGGVPAWLTPAAPRAVLPIGAGGYRLARSSGGLAIGDPVGPDLDGWTMPLGHDYLLAFDAFGVGHLSVL